MTRITHAIGQSPFHPIQSFTALACGDERVTLKPEFAMSEAFGVRPAEKLVQQLVAARTAKFLGNDPKPFLDEAIVHLKAVANEHGYAIDPIEDHEDEHARLYAEGHGKVAAE